MVVCQIHIFCMMLMNEFLFVLFLASVSDWEMVFYGTILPPEQLNTLPAIVVNQNQTSEKIPDLKSGACRVTTSKCLGLLLFRFILSAILIPGSS